MKILDVNHPFFVPRWRRIAVVAFCAGWAVLEVVAQSHFWAIITGGLAAYSYYALIATFDPEQAAKDPRKR